MDKNDKLFLGIILGLLIMIILNYLKKGNKTIEDFNIMQDFKGNKCKPKPKINKKDKPKEPILKCSNLYNIPDINDEAKVVVNNVTISFINQLIKPTSCNMIEKIINLIIFLDESEMKKNNFTQLDNPSQEIYEFIDNKLKTDFEYNDFHLEEEFYKDIIDIQLATGDLNNEETKKCIINFLKQICNGNINENIDTNSLQSCIRSFLEIYIEIKEVTEDSKIVAKAIISNLNNSIDDPVKKAEKIQKINIYKKKKKKILEEKGITEVKKPIDFKILVNSLPPEEKKIIDNIIFTDSENLEIYLAAQPKYQYLLESLCFNKIV